MALWLEGVAADFSDPEDLTLDGAQVSEACLFGTEPFSCLGQVLQVVVHNFIRCRHNAECEADRSIGEHDPWRLACFLQPENDSFLPGPRDDAFGEALIEDG